MRRKFTQFQIGFVPARPRRSLELKSKALPLPRLCVSVVEQEEKDLKHFHLAPGVLFLLFMTGLKRLPLLRTRSNLTLILSHTLVYSFIELDTGSG